MILSRLSRSGCHRVARVLQSYLDGEVDPPTATMVAEHLEDCRRCGLEASTYLAIKTAITATSATASAVDPQAVDRLRRFAHELSDAQDSGGPDQGSQSGGRL